MLASDRPVSAFRADDRSVCWGRGEPIVRWTWVSTKPGVTVLSPRSITAASSGAATCGPMAVITPSSDQDVDRTAERVRDTVEVVAAVEKRGRHEGYFEID